MLLFKPMMVNRQNKLVAMGRFKLKAKVLKENEEFEKQMHPQITNRSKILADKKRKKS